MALHADTVWEVRTTGNANNGGGYHSSGGSDYSQQDSPQLTLNDIVTNGTTTVTSATGGFTAAMVGNIINILTKGRFEIVGYTDTNTITIDRIATAGSGLTANVGGAVISLEDIDNVIVAGNTVWIKAGTYTSTTSIATTAGSTTVIVTIEGYNSARGDDPTGDNRPLLASGAQSFTIGSYTFVKHLRITITQVSGVQVSSAWMINCKVTQTANNANAITATYATLIDCEISSTGTIAYAVYDNPGPVKMHGCYVHDSYYGIGGVNTAGNVIEFCVMDTCTYGIQLLVNGRSYNTIKNNVFYNCTDAIYLNQTAFDNVIMNNIFNAGVDGIHFTATSPDNWLDYNDFYGNSGNDVTNISKGEHDIAVDPQFVNAAGGNFSLQAGSACIGAGFATRLGVG